MCHKQQVLSRIFICKVLNCLLISSPRYQNWLSPLGQLKFNRQKKFSWAPVMFACIWNCQKVHNWKWHEVLFTSLYTLSTLLSSVPAGSMASRSDSSGISKPQFPSLGATSGRIATPFIISHNPYSTDTYSCRCQGEHYKLHGWFIRMMTVYVTHLSILRSLNAHATSEFHSQKVKCNLFSMQFCNN